MKRIILLLLVLCCFRISYAEELTKEQQQLAWKYIQENLLDKEFLPNTFKKDIIINLKGEITSEDSIVVKDLIKSFQHAIPNLKIELSNKPGNFTLGLNNGKKNTVTTNMVGNHEVQSNEMEFPLNLTNSQRKQFIYFQLFKGLTFYNWQKQPFVGLSGCVFAENDFQSVTFSPYDLFILEKLYSPDFSIQLARNLSPEVQHTAWNAIRWQFMGKPNDPLVYRDYIFIKFLGEVSHEDSVCFKKLITDLEKILPERNRFQITDQDANLTFTINASGVKSRIKQMDNGKNITISELEINIPKDVKDEQRLKIIYFYLYRSLVHFSPAYGGSQKVPGCVFDEEDPEAITFHPFDKFILSKLYAPDFDKQFKEFFISKSSVSEYYKFRYSEQLKLVGTFGSYIIAILFFSILILLKIFRKHNWNFRLFLIQLLWVIIGYNLVLLFYLSVNNFSFSVALGGLPTILMNDGCIFVMAVYFFIVEKRIYFSSWSSNTKLFWILTNTLVTSYAAYLFLAIFFNISSSFDRYIYTLLFALAITIIRIFLISISAVNKAEIKQKDTELELLKEKNKQAELQSLRAKINPHFLYNALNSIASLATTDARKTEQMALALSDFFKYAINREQKQLNTLSEELNAIRTYLEIEKVRFGERLSFEIDCPKELLDIQIPQLLIQPLVENAIKHGLSQITENGLIGILIRKEDSQLKIRVYDNGPAFPDGPLAGFGIQNTQERIALLYGAKATINWQNGAEKFIEISIPV